MILLLDCSALINRIWACPDLEMNMNCFRNLWSQFNKILFQVPSFIGFKIFFLFWWHLATFNSINPHQDNGLLLTRYDFSNWLDLWGQCISSYMFQWWHFFFLDIAFLYWCHWLEFSYANDRNSHFGQDRTRARMDRYKTKVGFHGLVDVLIT